MITAFQNYLVNVRRYSWHTANSYGKDLKDFAQRIKAHDVDARWSTITENDITWYVAELTKEGKQPSTINRHIVAIRQLYNYLKRTGHDIENPARYVSLQKIGHKIPNTIPTDELLTAMEHARGTLRIMMLLMAKTGIRVQEMLDIEIADIDLGNGRIKIHGKGRKDRYVYLSDGDTRELAAYIDGRPNKIFGLISQRDVRTALYDHLSRYSQAKQLSPHAIRHTFATNAAKNGANVTTLATMLGHESIQTTQKYIDMSQTNIKQATLQFAQY